jgi:Phosphotransferase enzyme family
MLLPGVKVRRCVLRRARFRPGRKLKGFYEVTIETNRGSVYCTRPIAVNWSSDVNENWESALRVAEMQAEARRRNISEPFSRLSAESPQNNIRILVWPLDPDFEQLVRLSSWEYVSAMLSSLHRAPADHLPRGRHAISPIRYRPGQRHVLRYGGTQSRGSLFAKLYAADEGAVIYQRATGIAETLPQHGQQVNAIRPLAFIPQDGVVLYPRISGVALSDLRGPQSKTARWFERAGAALAALHQVSPAVAGPLQVHDFPAETSQAARASAHIRVLLPALGPVIDEALGRALDLHRSLPPEAPRLAHGDFKSEHLWVTSNGLTMIDFDSCCLADPALDIGKFLAHLRFWHTVHGKSGLYAEQNGFLAGYGRPANKRRVAIRLYQAVELIKITARRVRLFDRGWAADTEQLIGCAYGLVNDLELAIERRAHKTGNLHPHSNGVMRAGHSERGG